MQDKTAKLPLEGLRVLDFGHTVMGPTAGLVLADLGAEVIRVEPSPNGDPTRDLRGFGTGYFPFYNRNKKSIAVDLKTEEGREIVCRLAAVSDVMLENFGPGTIDRLGFGYAAMSALNPRIVYLSMKGFLPGPYEKRTALDEVVQMMSGLAYMTGPPGQPLRAGASVVDVMGGLFGVLGVLVALRQREETGRGTLVKSSLFESAMFLMGQHLAYASVSGEPVPPMPARVSAWAIYDLFDTADGEQIFLGITSDRHWKLFCDEFDRPDLFAQERLVTNNQRIEEKAWLKPEIGTMLAAMSVAEIEAKSVLAGLPFAHVARPEQLFEDEHLLAGERLLETRLPDGTVTSLPTLPLLIGDYACKLRIDPPAAGGDTRVIMLELGYDAATIDALLERRILREDRERETSEARLA
jgi:crotonobetainyl-CoA:carnitine CoA-transferase CaiB-like acyl-CoA transferase